jgi:hypothetical protein
MSAGRTWPAVVAASAVLAVVVVLLGAWQPVRAGVVAWFALAIPGGALVPLLRLRDVVAEVTLAIALSLALDVVVACTMLYSGVWSPPAGIVVLATVALAAAGLQARRTCRGVRRSRTPARSRASRSGMDAPRSSTSTRRPPSSSAPSAASGRRPRSASSRGVRPMGAFAP